MNLDFKAIKDELDRNSKAIVHLNNKKFLIKIKSKNRFETRPILNWFMSGLAYLVLFLFSVFLVGFILTTIAIIIDSIAPNIWENSNGTYSSFSAYGFLNKAFSDFWFLFLALNIYVTIILYKQLGYLLMRYYYKKEKTEILINLKAESKEISIDEFISLTKGLKDLDLEKQNDMKTLNSILENTENKLNELENE